MLNAVCWDGATTESFSASPKSHRRSPSLLAPRAGNPGRVDRYFWQAFNKSSTSAACRSTRQPLAGTLSPPSSCRVDPFPIGFAVPLVVFVRIRLVRGFRSRSGRRRGRLWLGFRARNRLRAILSELSAAPGGDLSTVLDGDEKHWRNHVLYALAIIEERIPDAGRVDRDFFHLGVLVVFESRNLVEHLEDRAVQRIVLPLLLVQVLANRIGSPQSTVGRCSSRREASCKRTGARRGSPGGSSRRCRLCASASSSRGCGRRCTCSAAHPRGARTGPAHR